MAQGPTRPIQLNGWYHPQLVLPAELLAIPPNPSALTSSELVLNCRARKIYRVPLLFAGEITSCFVYIFSNDSLTRAFKKAHALHILSISREIERQGLETIEVLAAWKPPRQLLNWESYLVAREISPVLEFPSGGTHVYRVHEWAEFSLEAAETVGRYVAGFHDRGFVHGDLKTRHILTRPPKPGERRTLVLVDLEKTRRLPGIAGGLGDILAARDLIQLLASLPVVCREGAARQSLLETYLKHRAISERRKRLMRRLLALYAPGGSLVQGKTVAGALWAGIRKRRR